MRVGMVLLLTFLVMWHGCGFASNASRGPTWLLSTLYLVPTVDSVLSNATCVTPQDGEQSTARPAMGGR